MLAWRRSWQRWSWLRCRERLRPARQMILSPVLYGHSTLQILFSQIVSDATLKCILRESLKYPDISYFHLLLGAHNTPSLWAGTNGGCVFAYMLRLPNVEHRADEPVTAQQGE